MTDEQLAEQVQRSRKACGCSRCVGGYAIGGRTLAMSERDSRPTSCVASTVLQQLLGRSPAAVDAKPPAKAPPKSPGPREIGCG